jgi:hypothetical protein
MSMTTETVTRRNPAAIALLVTGILLAVIGAILWIAGGNLLGHDQMVADYTHAFGLDNGVNIPATSPAIDSDTALVWWGIALVAFGAFMVFVRLVIAVVLIETKKAP